MSNCILIRLRKNQNKTMKECCYYEKDKCTTRLFIFRLIKHINVTCVFSIASNITKQDDDGG